MRVAYNDLDDRAGLRGYVHLKTHPHIIHTHICRICGMPGGLARRHNEGSPVEGDLRQEPGFA